MNDDIREIAERTWQGETVIDAYRDAGRLFEVTENVALITGFGNSIAVRTGDGLVLIDTSSPPHIGAILASLRQWDDRPITHAVYTHGHFDHTGGMRAIDAEADQRGVPRPEVIAHENVVRRFERYTETAGYNAAINARQFRARASDTAQVDRWRDWRFPDRTYSDAYSFEAGGVTFNLRHEKGETDDHTVVHIPSMEVTCCGDLFIWVAPNAGNPQKVQRYPREWAQALRRIIEDGPEVLIPSHNAPIFGRDRIAEGLGNVARYLESLVEQTVALLNADTRLDAAIQGVRPPGDLAGLPYLRPVYDEPEFIVRNTWRMYGGWWDGNPANLKPAAEAAVAKELAELAGGAGRLAERARALSEAGESRLAGHLAEFAALAAPDNAEVHRIRADVFARRAAEERSLMAKGIFRAAAEESGAKSG